MPDMKDFIDIIATDSPERPEEDFAAESKEMMQRLIVKTANYLLDLAQITKDHDGPFEPWVQDLMSGAAGNVEKVFNYLDYEYGQRHGIDIDEEMLGEADGEKDACYHKVKSRYKVWPSAYASGALVQCRKAGAENWGNKGKK